MIEILVLHIFMRITEYFLLLCFPILTTKNSAHQEKGRQRKAAAINYL